ncbi:uncharacterized protein FPRO_00788 [Fusarium proliferatum ET1]|uniref:Related to DNA mismatch repair protein PMS2 n=1 Tax=Fusarium proliferatum (strain ET1) TaxID=1227346 RepID=A0A1L7V740_FUSPR|nr:uncharacterized protein FPRO_00788 [Fusarium proliferatum ET1]CZR35090.1 related to DNA mismatch repair protein PMS2 [Fusarium proliferatum ET1]
MSISALPPSSAHLLRSSSSLLDPLSMVKELVDNSIDAGATSIEITVAPNTVDKVQVRDNGCGIQVDDFKSLGRRSHTSKLQNFDELHLKGGETLGFRGEALASANYLATIKITTRTAQDPIASLLLLNTKSGGISRQQPVSAPVGTTVQALNLFQNLPVRKQNAIKVSRKTLADIRRLLESYAIALPHIRLSFRVPGSSIQPWVYTPCSAPSTREAITQVFSHTLTTQLVAVSSDSHTGGTSTELQSKKLRIVASLPKPDSDANIIKGKGAFISVDSRPISSSRSTGKKLVSIFRSSISTVLFSPEKSRAPSNAFMQLSIQCSPGSYDPNVSPSKDELLFVDEPAVLSCFQNLCDSVYTKKVLGDKEPQHKPMALENSLSLLPWASKTVEPRLSDETRVDGIEDDLLLADQELVGSLNDEPGRVLVGTDVSGSGERTSPGAFTVPASPKKDSRSGNLDRTRGPKKAPEVREMMRTRLTVNLSRRETASTDLDGTEGLIPVHVTPRRAATPPVRDELQSSSRRRGLAPNHRFGNIDDYFRPSRDEPIQIATDETATPEIPHTRSYLTSVSHHRRLPLKELSESLLNLFREYEEEEYEDESDNESSSDLPFAAPNAVLSPHTSPRREVPSFLSQPFRPLLGQQSIRNSMPDLQLTLPANLQTPPSSDPTGVDNSTRRDRQSTNSILARAQRSSRGSLIPSVNRRSGDELRQSRLLPGSGPTASQGRRRSDQVCPGEFSSQAYAQSWLSDQVPHNHLAPRRGMKDSERSQTQGIKPWSHSLQVLLQRTPPPQATSPDEEAAGGYNPAPLDHVHDQHKEGFDSRSFKRQRRCSSVSTSESAGLDSRHLLMKRQRIHANGGRLKRIASTRLPLETISQNDSTLNLSVKIEVQMCELQAATVEFMKSGRATKPDLALQFRNMDEVGEVDRRLRRVTESWLKGSPSITVEYTFRSEVKGKSKA